MKHDLSEKELEGLSEAERAAVLAEASEDEKSIGGDVDTAASTTAEAEMKPDAKPEPEAKAEDKPEAKAVETPEDKPAEVEPEPRADAPFAVPFAHTSTVKPEEAKAKIDALQKQYDDGELDLPAFLAQRDAITTAIITDRVATKIAASSQEQTAFAIWQRSVETFIEDNPAYKDPVLAAALDDRVKVLAGDAANDGLSDRQLLRKAHDEVKLRMRVDDPVKDTKDPKKEMEAKRKPDLTDVPRTLAGTPAAAGNEAADDEFAAIEKLAPDSMAFERALAKLTPEQQERYLKGVTA